MSDIFLELVNISVKATYLIGAILLFRLIFRTVPKWVNCVLWSMVAFRLLCPFSIESVTSILPDNEFLPYETVFSQNDFPKGQHLSHYANYNPVDYSLGLEDGSVVFNEFTSPSHDFINPLYLLISFLTSLWIGVIIALFVYSIITCVKLHKNIAPSVLYKDNVYFCDTIDTPFIWGIIKPKIYIPSQIDENNLKYIIHHEKAHIHRGDFIWKPLAFLILAVYWFNPAIWLAYIFFCKDMETACDERVIKNTDKEYKANYSKALLSCSISKKFFTSCPVAFSETGVKSRIKNVLKYKKTSAWLMIGCLVLCVGFCLAFLTTPAVTLSKIIEEDGYRITTQEKKEIPLSIPINVFSDDIYKNDGQTFRKNEVVVYEEGNSKIFLKHALFSTEQIFLQFDFSYAHIPSSGSVLTGYKKDKNGYYPNTTGLSDTHIIVDNITFEATNPACIYTYGPKGAFGISISEAAFTAAKENITISAVCEELSYIQKTFENLPFEEADFFDNTYLQPVEYVMKSKDFNEKIKNAPIFYLYKNRTCEKVIDSQINYLGQFAKTELTEDNFYSAFVNTKWEDGYRIFLRLGFDSAWQLTDENDVYILLKRNDSFYMCCGKTLPEKGINLTIDCIYKMDIFNTETSFAYEDTSNGIISTITLNSRDGTFALDTDTASKQNHRVMTGNFSVAVEYANQLLYLEECDDSGDPCRTYIFEKTEGGYRFIKEIYGEMSNLFSTEKESTPIIPKNAEFLRTSEKLLINEWFDQKYIFPKVYNLGEYERSSYKHYKKEATLFSDSIDTYVLKVRYNEKNYAKQKQNLENMYTYTDLTTFNLEFQHIENFDYAPYTGKTFKSDDYIFRLVDGKAYGLEGYPQEMFFVGNSDTRKEIVFALFCDEYQPLLYRETFDERLHNIRPELYEYSTYMGYSDVETITLTDKTPGKEKTVSIDDYEYVYEICTAIDSLKLTSNHTEKPKGKDYILKMATLFEEEISVTLSSGCVKFGNGDWFKADEKAYKKLEKLLAK